MNRFLADRAIHPIIDRVYGFNEAADAYAYLRSGSHF
jgi:NADPH:quinone reductase-like Zn-dependent oxidoreductase